MDGPPQPATLQPASQPPAAPEQSSTSSEQTSLAPNVTECQAPTGPQDSGASTTRVQPVEVRDEGFTVISVGIDPTHELAPSAKSRLGDWLKTDKSKTLTVRSTSIVFIHGLQGHPKKTWLHGKWGDPKKPKSKFSKLFGRKKEEQKETSSSCYWPEDLVARDPKFKDFRILTYGYDSHVAHFFGGGANQTNIFGHGASLLNALEARRRDEPRRPIIFIVHSLGGLVLKEALRRSRQAEPYQQDLKNIYESTRAIIFMGTPHRGSAYADWGIIVRNIVRAAGFDATDRILRDLRFDAGTLDILHEEFLKMTKEEQFEVYTFKEGKGLKGIRGLTEKVVLDISAVADDPRERKDTINANHMNMCRFSDASDPGYQMVRDVLLRFEQAAKLRSDQIDALMDSLESSETSRRMESVGKAEERTFEWLFTDLTLDFKQWLSDERPSYWIKGKAASGKSTLMRFAYHHPETIKAVEGVQGLKCQAAFFFHDRGSYMQKSLQGLFRGILLQILSDIPFLKRTVFSVLVPHLKEPISQTWSPATLNLAFNRLLNQKEQQIHIFLFLDALDEYSGEPEEIARFVSGIVTKSATSATKVKTCFSSRPLQQFLDHANFRNLPGLRIDKHTGDDIRIVIDAKFRSNTRMLQYMNSPSASDREETNKLAEEIASKAEGVFLWVRLVLDDLLQEFSAGDTVALLFDRLLQLPKDLDNYYQYNIGRIDPRYLDDLNLVFELLCCARSPLFVTDFLLAFRGAHTTNLASYQAHPSKSSQEILDETERLIRYRCGGLVETKAVAEFDTGGEEQPDHQKCATYAFVPPFQVQFIHQTVKAFAQKQLARSRIAAGDSGSVNGFVVIQNFYLARLSQLSVDGIPHQESYRDYFVPIEHVNWEWSNDLVYYTRMAEQVTGQSQAIVLKQVSDRQYAALCQSGMWREMNWPEIRNLNAFAATAALGIFFKHQISYAELSSTKAAEGVSTLLELRRAAGLEPLFPGVRSEAWQIAAMLLQVCGSSKATIDRLFVHFLDKNYFNFASSGEAGLLKRFLELGSDPNSVLKYRHRVRKRVYEDRRRNPLHLFAEAGFTSGAKILLQFRAKINALNSEGLTALDVAVVQIHHIQFPPFEIGRNTDPSFGLEDRSLSVGLEMISLLLDAGGECASDAVLQRDQFGKSSAISDTGFRLPLDRQDLEEMEAYGLPANERFLNLPRLTRSWQDNVSDRVASLYNRWKGF